VQEGSVGWEGRLIVIRYRTGGGADEALMKLVQGESRAIAT
jgi:hypothetical protein